MCKYYVNVWAETNVILDLFIMEYEFKLVVSRIDEAKGKSHFNASGLLVVGRFCFLLQAYNVVDEPLKLSSIYTVHEGGFIIYNFILCFDILSSMLIFVAIITRFRPLYLLAFFSCLPSYLVNFLEFRTEPVHRIVPILFFMLRVHFI